MEYLKLADISFQAKGEKILDKISFSLEESEFLSILGPSGSGKSTLLKIISSLLPPDSGDIFYRSKNYLDYEPLMLRKEIIYCFQNPVLFGNKVMDNLSFPYLVREEEVDQDRILELLSLFNLSSAILDKSPGDLSGGEAQRINLIRALLFPPDLLLLDEASSALDRDNRLMLNNILRDLNSSGMTIISISHNREEAYEISSRILEMEDGKIIRMEDLK